MLPASGELLFERFAATAESAASTRPADQTELIRELFTEAATLLHNGLALDGLDEHDAAAVIDGLCEALVDGDPGAAVRARAEATLTDPGDLHDAEAAWAAYLTSAATLRI